jgi:hypothetical protein
MRSRTLIPAAAVGALLAAVFLPTSAAAQAPIKLATESGTATVSLGMLVQPQFDWEDRGDGTSAWSGGVRRLRFIAGGTVFRKIKFFVETDAPQLGPHSTNRTIDHELYLQDLVVTYEYQKALQVEGGLIMVPLSYNTNQSAASLLGVNYGPYSFLASAPTTSKVGRDWGTQLRGYVSHGRLEYRAGVFQGVREIDAAVPPRVAGRVTWYPLDTHDGLFYPGTTLGKKHLLAVGSGFDRQDDYAAHSVDVFYDRPMPRGNALTLQADVIRYDGGSRFAALPRQLTCLVEGGYYFKATRLGPFAQLARQDVAASSGADSGSVTGGIAWFARGHRLTLKVGVMRVTREGAPARTQLYVQNQVFAF